MADEIVHSELLPRGPRSFGRLAILVTVFAVETSEGEKDENEQKETDGDVRKPQQQRRLQRLEDSISLVSQNRTVPVPVGSVFEMTYFRVHKEVT